MSTPQRYDMISEALEELRQHRMSIRRIAEKYHIPESTLRYHQSRNITPTRVNQYLTHEEENIVIKDCLRVATRGFPINRKYVEACIILVIKEKNPLSTIERLATIGTLDSLSVIDRR